MNYYVEDSVNVRRNQVTITGCCGPVFNSVISVAFAYEGANSITLQQAKDFCYIDGTDSDTLLTMLITAAREICEAYANLSFINRTVAAVVMNDLGGLKLPYGPLVGEITSIIDSAGNTVADYDFTEPAESGNLAMVYDAGYEVLPARLKIAWLNQIKHLFDNRGEGELSPMAKSILKPIRVVS